MANLKFSQFTEQASPANVQFLVGYNGSDNVRIAPSNVADLSAYLPLAGGTMTGPLVISSNVQLQFNNSNVRINTDGSNRMYLKATLGYFFEGNGGYKMMLDGNSGNLGIGTTSPGSALEVNGEIDANGGDGYRIETKPFANWASDLLTLGDWDGEGFSTRFMGSSSSEVMRIKGVNVGIGTNNPSHKLDVRQSIGTGDIMANFTGTRVSGTYGPTAVLINCVDYGTGLKIKRVSSTGTQAVAFVTETNTQVGSITIGTTTTAYNTTSDYRLKENVVSITNGIDRIKQLQPKRFNFIGDEQIVDGFLAHEAQDVVPEAVTGEKDGILPNGDPVYQGIDQAKIVPLLTAALQEAVAKIEFLETRIETLENA